VYFRAFIVTLLITWWYTNHRILKTATFIKHSHKLTYEKSNCCRRARLTVLMVKQICTLPSINQSKNKPLAFFLGTYTSIIPQEMWMVIAHLKHSTNWGCYNLINGLLLFLTISLLTILTIFDEKYKLWSSLIYNFLHLPSEILFRNSFSNTISLQKCYANMKQQIKLKF
jgi:hypothetical protein